MKISKYLKIDKGKGRLRQVSNHIDASNGFHDTSSIIQPSSTDDDDSINLIR